MRIKVATNTPLPKYNCWFGISEKQERQTIHDLRKKIARDLKLESEPSNIQLSIEGFSLLPQTIIKDLVRDGDLITVKTQSVVKNNIKKRKISLVEEKHDTESTPPLKKKSKKSTEKDTKTKKELKTDLKKESKKAKTSDKESKKKSKSLKETTEKKDKSIATTTITTTEEPKTRSLPFEGTNKTKQRNMRRRLLKQHRAAAAADATADVIKGIVGVIKEVVVPETIVEKETPAPTKSTEAVIENLSIEEPLQLIKKNKNKKKNHLKQMDQRSHVHYPSEQVEKDYYPPPSSTTTGKKNAHGRAFVTFMEADTNYKPRENINNTNKYPPREYPINQVPTLFYAANEETIEEAVEEVEPSFTEPVVEIEAANEATVEAPINYEETYPEVTFSDNIPNNAKLAIKTLELTAAYTPEISDWKQVYLKNRNEADNTITIEYLPGFGKASTKGGKFDFKKKKNFNDWYAEEYEEEEEQEEEEEKEVTIPCSDVFAMRIMSA